jgi:hypothetical protein
VPVSLRTAGVPGGVGKKIIAARAARLLDTITPPDAVAAARRELAAALVEDLRRIDGQLRDGGWRIASYHNSPAS